MFNFLKPKKGETIKLKIDGMHCTSCSLNIDGELEDKDGVYSANTSYATSTSTINYDPTKIDLDSITQTITNAGYGVVKE